MEILVDKPEYQWAKDGNVILFKYKAGHITEEIAENVIKDKLEILDGKSYPTLIDSTEVVDIDSKARKMLGEGDGIAGISKCAILLT